MQIAEFTREAIERVTKRYDEEVFGIEAQGEEIKTTAYGMGAREVDKQVHSLMYGDDSPGFVDLIYVAELTMPDAFPWDEVEASGLDVDESEQWVVLRDEATPDPPSME